jgi:hypothetical protein
MHKCFSLAPPEAPVRAPILAIRALLIFRISQLNISPYRPCGGHTHTWGGRAGGGSARVRWGPGGRGGGEPHRRPTPLMDTQKMKAGQRGEAQPETHRHCLLSPARTQPTHLGEGVSGVGGNGLGVVHEDDLAAATNVLVAQGLGQGLGVHLKNMSINTPVSINAHRCTNKQQSLLTQQQALTKQQALTHSHTSRHSCSYHQLPHQGMPRVPRYPVPMNPGTQCR